MGLLHMDRPDTAWESLTLHLTCLSSQQSQEQENGLAEGELWEKIRMGVRKKTKSKTKNAVSKHLLGLIKWQVSIVERKFNPCLGFVPGLLNDDEN